MFFPTKIRATARGGALGGALLALACTVIGGRSSDAAAIDEVSQSVIRYVAAPEVTSPPGVAFEPTGLRLVTTARGVAVVWVERLRGESEGRSDDRARLVFSVLDRTPADPKSWRFAEPVVVEEGGDFWPNWADTSALVETRDGGLLGHRLERSGAGSYDYGIRLLVADSPVGPFASPGLLHDDAVAAEHGFVSWLAEGAGARAFWLDGRFMPETGEMALYTALVGSSGPEAAQILDSRVCECCNTDATMTRDGAVVVYRDRSEDDIRDIYRIHQTPDGWSEPEPVARDGWRIEGCPVNGPSIASSSRTTWTTWYTGAQDRARVRVAWSRDSGKSFGSAIDLDVTRPVGRTDIAVIDETSALVVWLDRESDDAPVHGLAGDGLRDDAAAWLRVARVTDQGEVEKAVLADVSPARATGFPQIVRLTASSVDGSSVDVEAGAFGQGFLVAWLDPRAETARIRTALLSAETGD